MGDGLPGGLVAGDGQNHEEETELFACQAFALGVGADEPAGDISEIDIDPGLGGGMGVDEHVDGAREVARILRVFAARHLIAPVEELLLVGVRNAHQAGDGLQRQMTRHVDHEVPRALPLGRPHDPVGLFAQVVLEASEGTRREASVSHTANPGVPGRVHAKEEILGRFAGRIGRVQPASEGRFGLHRPPRTPRDRSDIGVAGECPKAPVAVVRSR